MGKVKNEGEFDIPESFNPICLETIYGIRLSDLLEWVGRKQVHGSISEHPILGTLSPVDRGSSESDYIRDVAFLTPVKGDILGFLKSEILKEIDKGRMDVRDKGDNSWEDLIEDARTELNSKFKVKSSHYLIVDENTVVVGNFQGWDDFALVFHNNFKKLSYEAALVFYAPKKFKVIKRS